ncbi:MAG: hypothetical protein HON23_00860 [Rickettsiales bacterium]|nr:hypothetical protein [Rickettsiales bacterium]
MSREGSSKERHFGVSGETAHDDAFFSEEESGAKSSLRSSGGAPEQQEIDEVSSDDESVGVNEDVVRDHASLAQDSVGGDEDVVYAPGAPDKAEGVSVDVPYDESRARPRSGSLSQDMSGGSHESPSAYRDGLDSLSDERHYPPPPKLRLGITQRQPSSLSKSKPRIALIGVDDDALEQRKKSDTLGNMFLNLFWGASSRRTPAGMYDGFVGTLSAFLRSQVEEHTALLAPRLLQEPALWDFVNKVGLSDMEGDSLEKPKHLKKLSDLVGIEEGILTIIANNLLHSETLQSTPASDSYDQRNLVEPLAFLSSYGEPLLAPPLGVTRERHIKGVPQKLHGVYAQQASDKSRSSRGSHVSLYPHTEDGYKKTSEISQAFLLVCVKKGAQTTPTHVISFEDIMHDMSLLREVLADKSKDKLAVEYDRRIEGKGYHDKTVLSMHARVRQELQWQYEERLQAETFDMFEGPTMDKQRSTPYPMLTKEHDLDGREYITYRANLNIREKVHLADFAPDPTNPLSDPSYDVDVCRLWRHYTQDALALDSLFPKAIFGNISLKQKADNLKLLLALRTKPKTPIGVEILRDLIWVFRTLHHDGVVRQLYTDQYFMEDYEGSSIRRSRKASPGASHWQEGYAAMFRNKEVMHYRANFAEKFYRYSDKTELAIGRMQAFFEKHFTTDALEVQACFEHQIAAILESEDEQVRFYKTYSNVIEYSEEMALALLFPHKLYREFKLARGTILMRKAIKDFLTDPDLSINYRYLLESQSSAKVNLGRLQEVMSSFESYIPQHVDIMMRDHADVCGSEEYRVLRAKLSNVTSTKKRMDELRRESVTTRDARWLIRMYLKDADNNALPSYHIFQKHLLRRILGDGMLSSEVALGKYDNLLLLKEIELAVEISTRRQEAEGGAGVSVSDELVQEVLRLKGMEYGIGAITQGRKVIVAARFMFAKAEGQRGSSYLGEEGFKPCESRLNIKNIVRFMHQLQQYQLGCKILGSKLAEEHQDDMRIVAELLFSEIRDFHEHHALRAGNILEKEHPQGGLGLTVSEIEVLLDITSTPGSDKFKQFIISNDTSNLTPFSLLDACTKMPEGLVDISVLQDVGFATIIKVQVPPNETKERYAVSVLDHHKKKILLQEDRLLRLKKCTYTSSVRAGLLEELTKRGEFLCRVIDRSESRKMPGSSNVKSITLVEIKLEQQELDYKIARWYHAEYIDIRLDGSGDVVMSGDALSNKIIKMLRSRGVDVKLSYDASSCNAYLDLGTTQYMLSVNSVGEYSIPLAQCQEVMQEHKFYIHQGRGGDSDRVVLEDRPWFDEYDRGLITETEGVEVTDAIKALIADKALLKTEIRRRDVEAMKARIPEMSEVELRDLIDHDLERIKFLLRTTNDLRFNHTASIAEQGVVLDTLVMGRAKQNDISHLGQSRLQKICDIILVDTLNKAESPKVKFTRAQIAQLEVFLKGKFEQNDMVGRLDIFDTNEWLEFNCFAGDDYRASIEGLRHLGIIANEGGIFFPQHVLTLKVREDVLCHVDGPSVEIDHAQGIRAGNRIEDYEKAVQDVWAVHGSPQAALGDSKPSDAFKAGLRALRQQRRDEYFDKVERTEGGYKMSYEMGSLLLRKLGERSCHFDEGSQRVIFYYQNDDGIIQEGHVDMLNQQGYCAISSEDFAQLSLHYSLQYDEQKQGLYFAERDLKTLGYAQSKLKIEYDLSNYINEIHQHISVLRGSVLDLNKMLYRSFIQLYQSFSQLEGQHVGVDFSMHKMQKELKTLEQQPKLGVELIQGNIQMFIEGYLASSRSPVSQDDWGERIRGWKLAIRDKMRDEPAGADEGVPEQRPALEILRFLDLVGSWCQDRDCRGRKIKECKATQAVIWESVGHPDFIPKAGPLVGGLDDKMSGLSEAKGGGGISWVDHVLIASIKAAEVSGGK